MTQFLEDQLKIFRNIAIQIITPILSSQIRMHFHLKSFQCSRNLVRANSCLIIRAQSQLNLLRSAGRTLISPKPLGRQNPKIHTYIICFKIQVFTVLGIYNFVYSGRKSTLRTASLWTSNQLRTSLCVKSVVI